MQRLRERLARRRLALVATTALGAIAGIAALPLIPGVISSAGPATIGSKAHFGGRGTVLNVPPLGAVEVDSHWVPVTLELSLTEIDIPNLTDEITTSAGRDQLADEIEDDLRGLAVRLAAQLLIGAAVVGSVASALLPARRWWYPVTGAIGGILLAGSTVAMIAATFNVESFQEPRFTGALVKAPVVIEAVRKREITISGVTSRFETAASRLSELLTLVAEPRRGPAGDDVAILHVSDIHSNPLGIEITEQLAREFQVEAVIDTGDLTNFGLSIESNIGRFIRNVPAQYYFVPGNHDSRVNREALTRIRNVTVLDGTAATVAGIEVMGWADPTYTNWNRLTREEAEAVLLEEASEVGAAVADEDPDVLAVHNESLAAEALDDVPLVLAGHAHERGLDIKEGATVLTVGSTGATGFKFFVEAARDYEAEIVYFNGTRAVAVDYVSFSGFGSDFEIERTTLPPDDDEQREAEPPEIDPTRTPEGRGG